MKNTLQRLLAPLGYQLRSTDPARSLPIEDAEFLALYALIRSHTLVSIDRCFMLYQCAKATRSLSGDIAELGVYRGGTARMLAEIVKDHEKRIYLFDSFSGMPWTEKDTEVARPMFADVTLDVVREYLSGYRGIQLRPGFFPITARGLEDAKFSLVYLDADLYESTKSGLEFFYPRMTPGGIIVLDDYGSGRWTGVKTAVDAFVESTGTAAIVTTACQAILIKH